MKLEDPESQRLLAQLCALTGEEAPEALRRALQERLNRMKREFQQDLVKERSDELFGY